MEEQEKIIQEPEKRKTLKKGLFLFLAFIILFYIYMRYIEPSFIVVKEYPVIDNALPASFDGTKIVHFSDILYGTTIQEKNLDKLVKKINELKPDIVVFTGDLLNDTIHLEEKSYDILKENLKKIEAKYRKYAVLGDNDYTNIEASKDILESSGFILLENKNDLLYFGGNDPLLFIGTPSLLKGNVDLTSATTSNENTEKYYKIWLSHEPSIIDRLYENNIKTNLILSGHTLHGLVAFPFNGYLLHQDGTNNLLKDYYEKDLTKMYISNGIGTYKYSIRLRNMPSINLYRLYSHL